MNHPTQATAADRKVAARLFGVALRQGVLVRPGECSHDGGRSVPRRRLAMTLVCPECASFLELELAKHGEAR